MSKAVDWPALEGHYRAGLRSLRDIGAEFGVTDTAVRKHAKRHGWTRDLAAKIRAKADALVRVEAVCSEVRTIDADSERAIIRDNAALLAHVTRSHRQDIAHLRTQVMRLLHELEAETMSIIAYRRLACDAGVAPGDYRAEMFEKAISLPARVSMTKALAESLKILVGLERQAFGLRDDAAPDEAKAIPVTFGAAVRTNIEEVRARLRERAGVPT